MVHFHFTYDPNVSLEQRLGFELASAIWSQFLTDEVTINLHVVTADTLNGGQAVGGAIPLFHEQNYGVYQEYVKQDATSEEDATLIANQQVGNTVDVLIGDQVVDGNSTIMLTSAQAKALGMEGGVQLENGSTWDRDLVDPNALDGYILINNSFDWSYDFTRQNEVPKNTLDFLTMALHEIGHTLGFVSGLDGLLDVVEHYSGQTQAEGFTPLDLLRYTDASQALDNPDGQVADLTVGADAKFSLDGETNLATFSTGQDTSVGGDGYQASHWERFKEALGIMDPTLGYQERTDISHLDLQAFDVLGWDIKYDVLDQGLNLQALYNQALQSVSSDFGIEAQSMAIAIENNEDSYTLGYSRWWQDFADHMAALGYSRWWSEFEAAVLELGYSRWWQALEQPMQELGYSRWWQAFEELAFELGYSRWWQDFEHDMMELGYSRWWQGFEVHQSLELGYSRWWQDFEDHMAALGYSRWWQDFESDVLELGYSRWWQALEEPMMELGYSRWWQAFEELVVELGYSRWWQDFEHNMMELGYSRWWQGFEEQALELGYSRWWQEVDPFLATLEKVDGRSTNENSRVADGGVGGHKTTIFQGGNEDDIIAGDAKQDRINAGDGDDLIDGKAGHDVLWGEGGRDIIYGHNGDDHIYGGDDDDRLMGENDNDDLYGEAGDDIIKGGAGDDIVSGGDGRDDLQGGSGRDVVSGGDGDDRLSGGDDSDILIGGQGADQANGGSGNDLIYGDTLSEAEAATLSELRQQLQKQPVNTKGDNSTGNSPSSTISTNPIRVEAEDMNLSGNYDIYTGWKYDSGDIVRTSSTSTATTTFTGEAGRYLVVARYFDEASGQASLSVDINGVLLDNWVLDQDNGHYYTRTIAQDISLNPGDEFQIQLAADGHDNAYLDYLEFVPLNGLFVTHLDPQLNTDSSSTAASSASTSISTDLFSLSSSSFHSVSDSASSTSSGSTTNVESDTIRVEAESMTFIGDYLAANYSFASNGQLIEISNQGQGKALTAFAGETGFYNIIVGYHDEDADGTAKLSAHLNGIELDQWQLDQNIYSSPASSHNFVTRTVASGVVLSTGDIFELAGLRGEGRSDEAAHVDYIEFVKIAAPTTTNHEATVAEPTEPTVTEVVIIGDPIRLEAESMRLSGYSTERTMVASNNSLIRTSSSGTATTNFTGDTGYYNIVVAYYDENDGLGQLTANLAGSELDRWQLNQALGGNYASSNNFVTRQIATQIYVNTGDELALEGLREHNEFARIDYVEFVPVSAPVTSQPTSTDHDDFLQGGSGSDIVFGGEGNDIIYGESSGNMYLQDISDHELEYNDILVGGDGDDAIYGNVGDDFLYGDSSENSVTRSLNNGLVSHWTFDDADGLQVNDSAGPHTGSMINMNTSKWTTGRLDGALEFDGSNDRIEVSDHATLDITDTLTLATWVKADTVQDYDGLIIKGNNSITYGLDVMSNGRLNLEANYRSVTGGTSHGYWRSDANITTGQWHHVAVTYDGSQVQFYINGQLDSSHQANITFGTSNEPLMLGTDLAGGSHFDGALDDARVYSRALSADEIHELVTEEHSSGTITSEDGGKDALYGGVGNDSLDGGVGNDVLDGSDAIALGISEQDVLIGGNGADTFVLGSWAQPYYQGGGDRDYALIQDFNNAEDRLQLHGSASDYRQQQQGADVHLYYEGNGSDLVAIFEKNTTANTGSIELFTSFV